MDVYGLTTPEVFRIDDLLDFSNDDLISSTDSTLLNHHHHQQQHFSPPENPYNYHRSSFSASAPTHSTDFTDDLCVPSDDVAELEWLSQFVDDSFSDFPANELTGTVAFRSDTSFTGRARSKRSRAASTTRKWCSSPQSEATTMIGKSKTTATAAVKLEMTSSSSEINNNRDWSSLPVAGEVRRCTHCASEKTPQWRTGPLGPKTLCNACGVRYKSDRLVPEYRPAASPTFVLTQHSNSHRKVMELRRQKEMMHQDEQQQQQQQRQFYRHHHHHHHDFEVC